MSLSKWRKIRAFTVFSCIVTFTTFLFSYTLRDPSLYFFKYAIHKSDNFSKGQCGCRQCMTELEDDPWFTERFNLSVHPLMSRKNSLLTDDTYHWWQVRCTTARVRIELVLGLGLNWIVDMNQGLGLGLRQGLVEPGCGHKARVRVWVSPPSDLEEQSADWHVHVMADEMFWDLQVNNQRWVWFSHIRQPILMIIRTRKKTMCPWLRY